jgi:hypothetical protein
MMAAVAPMWDGNGDLAGSGRRRPLGRLPIIYATLFSAFYLPLLLMLAGLILRGVAFEFRYKAERMRPVWDAGFAGGSCVAARRRVRLAQSVCADLRRRTLSQLHAAWRILASAKKRWRASRIRLPSGPLFVGRTSHLPDSRLRLCVCRASSGHRPMARTFLFVRPSRDRYRGGDRPCCERAVSPRWAALLYGLPDFHCGIRHAGDLILALHDFILYYYR